MRTGVVTENFSTNDRYRGKGAFGGQSPQGGFGTPQGPVTRPPSRNDRSYQTISRSRRSCAILRFLSNFERPFDFILRFFAMAVLLWSQGSDTPWSSNSRCFRLSGLQSVESWVESILNFYYWLDDFLFIIRSFEYYFFEKLKTIFDFISSR